MEDHVRASSSAHDASASRKEARRRADKMAYSMPGQKAPRFVLCDQHGSSLEPALVPLADSLVEFELNLFQRVHAFHKKQTSCTDEERKTEAVRWVGEYKDFLQQRKDIENGQRRFSHSYLRDESFVPIWTEGLRVVKNVFKNSNSSKNQTQKQNVYMGYITSYEKQARTLQNQMVDIALQGLLEEPIINSIRNRWVKLDSSIEWYYEWRNRTIDPVKNTSTRIAPKWYEVRRLVETDSQKTGYDVTPVQNQFARKSTKFTQSNTIAAKLGRIVDRTFLLCLILFSCIVTSTAMFALGYAHSPHLKGTINDADFWFLIQAAIMQLLGISVSALLERESGNLPKWRWVFPTAIAGTFSVIAVPLYLAVPTEWSSFLSLTAGATQSFMILQHFLA